MISKILLWVAELLSGIVLAWMLTGRHGKRGAARVLSGGRIEFAPDRLALGAWPLIVILLAWMATKSLMHSHGKPLEIVQATGLGLLALLLLISFPETIVVTGDGLEQIYWFWRHKRIQWNDIEEINTGEKSCTVTITGVDGTKIVHSGQLADRPRLLMELKQRCGDNLPSDFPRESIEGL